MAEFTDEQRQNAGVIATVGRSLGASERDILIAIMTAMQESGLRNLGYGDRDSVGLFQQRDAWGSREQRMDPAESARMFFNGGGDGQPGLLDVGNRDTMSLTQAAQDVQRSAFPDAYAKHESSARQLMGLVAKATLPLPGLGTTGEGDRPSAVASGQSPTVLGGSAPGALQGTTPVGIEPTPSAGPDEQFMPKMSKQEFMMKMGGAKLPGFTPEAPPVDASGIRGKITQEAMKLMGTPYRWGGTRPGGFDCSGFVQYVYSQMGIDLPRISWQQARAGARIDYSQARPGDLIAWDNSTRNNGADHIAIYLGKGWVAEAPRPGESVQRRKLGDDENFWAVQMKL